MTAKSKDEEKTIIDCSFDALTNVKFSDHEGEYILLIGDRLVGHSVSEKELFEKAKKDYPDAVPFIVKVPKKEAIML